MIEFFFDCSSPWTYLAFHNIQPLAKELGAEIIWRPILVGGIFNTVNPSVYAQRETPVPLKAGSSNWMTSTPSASSSRASSFNSSAKRIAILTRSP